MLAFWELAEKEIGQRKLDTCNDQLGRGLIEAYHRTALDYCLPPGEAGLGLIPIRNTSYRIPWEASDVPSTRIRCAPAHRDAFSKWWPYPAAPCLSTSIRAVQNDERKFNAVGCNLTEEGRKLNEEMGTERFLGSVINRVPEGVCKERIDRTLLVIGRQDQWNP
jgi:hypothetical protein